jgi:UDP-N-acetylglucosamine enolpyruvyl transferase
MMLLPARRNNAIENAAQEPEIVDWLIYQRNGRKVKGAGTNIIHVEGAKSCMGPIYRHSRQN